MVSRMMPPPVAATKDSTSPPNRSRRRRTPTRAPLSANTKVPTRSSTTRISSTFHPTSRPARPSSAGGGWPASRPQKKRRAGARLSVLAEGSGRLRGLALLDGLHGQADATLLVHFQHLDLHGVAFLELVGDLLDALVGNLRDVHQAVLAGGDGDEGAEVHDLGDAALVNAARLDVRGDLLDAGLGGLGSGGVHRGDDDGAVILDVDLGAGFLGDGLDGGATLADHLADLVRMDLDGQQARGVLAQLGTRGADGLGHLAEDVQAALPGLGQRH